MFDTLKQFKFWRSERKRLMKSHDELVDENSLLKEQVKKLEDFKIDVINGKLATATAVVKNVLSRGIAWYDFEELDRSRRLDYIKRTKEILESPVFNNEINSAVTDIIAEIAKNSKDFQQVMDLRMTINGLQLLRERLEIIANTDLNSGDY